MPVIRVDDEVFKKLQKRAGKIPFTSPNYILRKVFGLDTSELDNLPRNRPNGKGKGERR